MVTKTDPNWWDVFNAHTVTNLFKINYVKDRPDGMLRHKNQRSQYVVAVDRKRAEFWYRENISCNPAGDLYTMLGIEELGHVDVNVLGYVEDAQYKAEHNK